MVARVRRVAGTPWQQPRGALAAPEPACRRCQRQVLRLRLVVVAAAGTLAWMTRMTRMTGTASRWIAASWATAVAAARGVAQWGARGTVGVTR